MTSNSTKLHKIAQELKYGTQFYTNADGVLEPRSIIDGKKVDQRRAEVGLEPLSEYKKSYKPFERESEIFRFRADQSSPPAQNHFYVRLQSYASIA